MLTAMPASTQTVESQLRMVRRGGAELRASGSNNYYALSLTVVSRGLGERKKKRRSNSSMGDNLVEPCLVDLSEHVPFMYTGMRVAATSRRVDDPTREYYDAKVVNPWIFNERILFLKLFVWHGKGFVKITRHLTFKWTHDVVQFYYEQKLTFRLKEMRAKFVAGEVITVVDQLSRNEPRPHFLQPNVK